MTAPLFRFEMWATHRPDDAYYHTNWDRKQKVTVVAANRQEAFNVADAALGNAGRGRLWVFRILSITDHRIPVNEVA